MPWYLEPRSACFTTHKLSLGALGASCYEYSLKLKCSLCVQGLMPLYLDPKTARFTTNKLSLGALGDSYYEYLLKLWILRGRSPGDEMYRAMWEQAMDEMIERLVFISDPEELTYVAEWDRYA